MNTLFYCHYFFKNIFKEQRHNNVFAFVSKYTIGHDTE